MSSAAAVSLDTLADVVRIYDGSDGDATKALYERLVTIGPAGEVALNLFRAHKNSSRAKRYRGGIRGRGSYRGMAYDRKAWAMDNLCKVLCQHGEALGIRWGWKRDPLQPVHSWVLYVEAPTGQVSFHAEYRGEGPDFAGEWDGERDVAPDRICRWCSQLLDGAA